METYILFNDLFYFNLNLIKLLLIHLLCMTMNYPNSQASIFERDCILLF